MNNAENHPVDVAQEREWLLAEKERRGASWAEIGRLVGRAGATLSLFGTGKYEGDNEQVARQVYRWRQGLAVQADRTAGIIADPGFFETPTSRRIEGLLTIAHYGRITVGATGPGTGKTMTVEHYQASVANVWVATMRPSMRTISAMVGEVLRATGFPSQFHSRAGGSDIVLKQVVGKRGLLVIDEANHLSLEQMEEARGWHDKPGGPGLCLLGNEELLMRIRGGQRRDAFARLNSRIAQSHIQNLPIAEDVDTFCDAWGVSDASMRNLLRKTALTAGAGGLRECRQIVEQASLLAAHDERPLDLSDLRDAMANRATRLVAA